jgi:hypothetical protein
MMYYVGKWQWVYRYRLHANGRHFSSIDPCLFKPKTLQGDSHGHHYYISTQQAFTAKSIVLLYSISHDCFTGMETALILRLSVGESLDAPQLWNWRRSILTSKWPLWRRKVNSVSGLFPIIVIIDHSPKMTQFIAFI